MAIASHTRAYDNGVLYFIHGPGSGHLDSGNALSRPWTLEVGSTGAARCASGDVCASGKLSRLKVSRQHVARKARCAGR
jgi:hypothetical protein